MKRQTVPETESGGIDNIADDAKTLLAATADAAEEKVVEARERLAAAIDKGRNSWQRVQDRCVQGAKATDEMVRSHPYQAIGIAFGVGALLGFLLTRRD